MSSRFFTHRFLWIGVVAILLVAFCVRFYKLGAVPHGITWDEAAIGYNGLAVATTGKDEWLKTLPISFQSFGDYKAPVAIYISGLTTLIFGLSVFSLRLPFATASLFAIAAFGAIVWHLTQILIRNESNEKVRKNSVRLTLSAMTLMAVSPWHLHYSRAGFESGMALSFYLIGIFCLLHFVKLLRVSQKVAPTKTRFAFHLNDLWLFAGTFFLITSMYTYHSAKIVIPLFSLYFGVLFKEVVVRNWQKLGLACLFAGVLLSPMLHDLSRSSARLEQTSFIVSSELSLWQKAVQTTHNFGLHFSPEFLVFGKTDTLRHGMGGWGVLLPTTTLFIVFALIFLARKKLSTKHLRNGRRSIAWFGVAMMLIGLLPAAISADTAPHSNRALLALPGFLILAAIGFDEMVRWVKKTKVNENERGNHGEKNTIRDAFIGIVVSLHLLFFLTAVRFYFDSFAHHSAEAFLDGYLDAFEIVNQYQRGFDETPPVEKIMFTNTYGQPYIFALFSKQISPYSYRGGALEKFEFTDVDIGDFQRENALIIGTPQDEDLPTERADHLIYGSDGSIRFQMFYRP